MEHATTHSKLHCPGGVLILPIGARELKTRSLTSIDRSGNSSVTL
jgi:hypothetical protein